MYRGVQISALLQNWVCGFPLQISFTTVVSMPNKTASELFYWFVISMNWVQICANQFIEVPRIGTYESVRSFHGTLAHYVTIV